MRVLYSGINYVGYSFTLALHMVVSEHSQKLCVSGSFSQTKPRILLTCCLSLSHYIQQSQDTVKRSHFLRVDLSDKAADVTYLLYFVVFRVFYILPPPQGVHT
jgi:hypothetical protein